VADKKLHLLQVAHNEALLQFLSNAPYPDWVATVTFYAALHCVQAYLLSKRPPENPQSHMARDISIDNDPFLNSVRNSYRDLQDVSEAARYYGFKPSSDELKKTASDLAAVKKHLKHTWLESSAAP
jgi:hypothetical protein